MRWRCSIAVAAVVDPAVTTSRRTRPILSLVAAGHPRPTARSLHALGSCWSETHRGPGAAPFRHRHGPGGGTARQFERDGIARGGGGTGIGQASVVIRRITAPTQAMLESRVDVLITLATHSRDATPGTIRVGLTTRWRRHREATHPDRS
ncbi:MAG: hypothetical protein IPP90_06075 [Gemmatimonadaceae bacterium]|nr:hypothetical protein [Gemmatimonadaceae bacterium]